MNDFIRRCQLLPSNMIQTSQLLLANRQGGILDQMTVSPQQPSQCRSLSSIVVHTAAVILCRQRVDILQPFVNMFNNPAVLAVSGFFRVYLPALLVLSFSVGKNMFRLILIITCRMLTFLPCKKTCYKKWEEQEELTMVTLTSCHILYFQLPVNNRMYCLWFLNLQSPHILITYISTLQNVQMGTPT